MNKHWKPILTLMVLAPILTEVITENTPAIVFFTPVMFLFLITIGYGFPLLVIREVYVRKSLGLVGLFFLGLMYGLYNEGLVAKTIFNPFHSPVDSFTMYGLVGSVRLPWTLLMTSWHALYAVIVPIMLVGCLFPDVANESWIGKRMTWVLGAFCFLVGALAFFSISPTNPRGVPGDLGTLLVIWVILWFAIKKLPRVPLVVKDEFFLFSWKKALGVGLGLYCILDLIPFILSGLHVNSFLFVGYFVGALVLIIRKISKIEVVSSMQMVFVGLGGMIPTALLVIPIGIYSGRQDHVVTSLIFLIIFAVAVKRMRRKLGVLYS